MQENNNYGVIHEVGNLGIGFDPVSKEDAEKIKKQQEKEKLKE